MMSGRWCGGLADTSSSTSPRSGELSAAKSNTFLVHIVLSRRVFGFDFAAPCPYWPARFHCEIKPTQPQDCTFCTTCVADLVLFRRVLVCACAGMSVVDSILFLLRIHGTSHKPDKQYHPRSTTFLEHTHNKMSDGRRGFCVLVSRVLIAGHLSQGSAVSDLHGVLLRLDSNHLAVRQRAHGFRVSWRPQTKRRIPLLSVPGMRFLACDLTTSSSR